MSLLSPTKPVRTRFHVTSEGFYTLSADLLPSTAHSPASPNPTSNLTPSITSSRPASTSAAASLTSAPSSSPSHATSAPPAASPLRLPSATKVSVAPFAFLARARDRDRPSHPRPSDRDRDRPSDRRGAAAAGGSASAAAVSGAGAAQGGVSAAGDGAAASGTADATHANGQQQRDGGAGAAVMFSFRKLSSLGGFSGFGGGSKAAAAAAAAATAAAAAAAGAVGAQDARVDDERGRGGAVGGVGAGAAVGAGAMPLGSRAENGDDRGPAGGDATQGGRQGYSAAAAEGVAPPPPVAVVMNGDIRTRERGREKGKEKEKVREKEKENERELARENANETDALRVADDLTAGTGAGAGLTAGVLAYNFGDTLVVVDLAGHSAFSTTAPEATLVLKMRNTVSAHALAHTGDRLRLLVGCVNGEVAFWEDVSATYLKESGGGGASSGNPAKRSRSAAAIVANGISTATGGGAGGSSGLGGNNGCDGAASASANGGVVGTPISGSAATSQSSQITFNRDGAFNSTRVVAVRWLPGPGFRFVAVHVDGTVIVYDTRNRKGGGGVGSGGGITGTNAATDYGHVNGDMNGHATPPRHGLANGYPHSNGDSGGGSIGVAGGGAGGVTGAVMGGFSSVTESSVGTVDVADRERSGLADRFVGSSATGTTTSVSTSAASAAGTASPTTSSVTSTTPASENGSISRGSSSHRRTSSLPHHLLSQHDVLSSRPSRAHKRANPVFVCHAGGGAVTDAAFAPAGRAPTEHVLLAIPGRDGCLRIVDLAREAMVIGFRSYFGALLCAAWSPDGRYVAAGGEDDLVSIWCPAEERIIARCDGHTSWISAVAWDPTMCRDGRYRLASAGQDTKLLLWDFSLDMLVTRSSAHRNSARKLANVAATTAGKPPSSAAAATSTPPNLHNNNYPRRQNHPQTPQAQHPASPLPSTATLAQLPSPTPSLQQGHSPSSVGASVLSSPTSSAPLQPQPPAVVPSPERRPGKLARLRGHASSAASSRDDAEHHQPVLPPGPIIPALGRADVPIIEPVLVHVAHVEPLTDVWFVEAGIVTADCVGNVKLWARPPQQLIPPLSLGGNGSAASTTAHGAGGASQTPAAFPKAQRGDLD